ncbi:MAG: 30S ribosomal protein S18 [Proteobacteria bacterium]|nr:30S ribosomal protein S18 [Pseudomonadota bacterium]
MPREARDNNRNSRGAQGAEGGQGGFGGGERGKKVFFRRRKTCPLSEKGAPAVDYKNVRLLSKFISERGKIMPRRISAVSAKKQRELATAIKRARNLALLPFVNK